MLGINVIKGQKHRASVGTTKYNAPWMTTKNLRAPHAKRTNHVQQLLEKPVYERQAYRPFWTADFGINENCRRIKAQIKNKLLTRLTEIKKRRGNFP